MAGSMIIRDKSVKFFCFDSTTVVRILSVRERCLASSFPFLFLIFPDRLSRRSGLSVLRSCQFAEYGRARFYLFPRVLSILPRELAVRRSHTRCSSSGTCTIMQSIVGLTRVIRRAPPVTDEVSILDSRQLRSPDSRAI